jgi:hypothetical protein
MARKGNGNLLIADYPEDIVGFALEAYLTALSFPLQNFTIEPFSKSRERYLGADARLTASIAGFLPFYMQFKRPCAYPSDSRSSIIKDRNALSLTTKPRALFFGLRKKKPEHSDYQHNILFRLRSRLHRLEIGEATYVCPLFLDRSAYRPQLHSAALARRLAFHGAPWGIQDLIVYTAAGKVPLRYVPILSEHIAIPPHALVTEAEHFYSFTEDGNEVCFHSPQSIPDGPVSLQQYLARLYERIAEKQEALVKPAQSLDVLRKFVNADSRQSEFEAMQIPGNILEGDDGMAAWFSFGNFLRNEYSIEQYAFVKWNVEQ